MCERSLVKDIIPHLHLLDFYDKKKGITLCTIKEMGKYLSTYINKHPSCREECCERFLLVQKGDVFRFILEEQEYEIILDLLDIGNGKISICGFGVSELIECEVLDEFNLFIHSCTKLEADILLKKCLDKINKLVFMPNIYYNECSNNIIFEFADAVIRIYLDVYSDKMDILLYNGCFLEKHGWNPIDGYFSVLSTALTIILGILPVNESDEHSLDETGPIINNINRPVHELEYISDILYTFEEEYITCEKLTEKNLHEETKQKFLYKDTLTKMFLPKNNTTRLLVDPITIGIPNNVYIVVVNIQRYYNLPKEILNLICLLLVREEANESLKAILS